jgi:hypothetical protein
VIGAACVTEADGGGGSDHNRRRWRLSIGYRKQRSHRHFVGTVEQKEREEQETQIVNDYHLFDVNVAYEFTPRFNMSVSVPFLVASRTRPATLDRLRGIQNAPDQVSHSIGFGDISVSGGMWVLDPARENRPKQNVYVGVGVKLPTGNEGVKDTVQTPTGPREIVVDQSIQLGDGGWGLTLNTEMYRDLGRVRLFASGLYLINPRNTNGVPTGRGRASEAIMSVADQYLARVGVSVPVPKKRNWTVSLFGRIEGVPARDLLGKSDGFRRPGYAISIEPGVIYRRARDVWSLSVPIAVKRNRVRSVPDIQDGRHGDAAFADYLITLGYSHIF